MTSKKIVLGYELVNGKRWPQGLEDMLIQLINDGFTYPKISELFGVSERTIRAKGSRLIREGKILPFNYVSEATKDYIVEQYSVHGVLIREIVEDVGKSRTVVERIIKERGAKSLKEITIAQFPEGYKYCSACKTCYPATNEYFHHNKRRGDGLNTICATCSRLRNKNLEDKQKRTCSRCGVEKTMAEFSTNHGRKMTVCKECSNIYVKLKYKK